MRATNESATLAAKESTLDNRGLKDRFGIGWLSRITDADAPVGSNEHVPRVYLKTENAVTAYTYIITVKKRIEGVWVNVIEQRWNISRISISSVR